MNNKTKQKFERQALNMGYSIIKIDDQYVESKTVILETGFIMGQSSRNEEVDNKHQNTKEWFENVLKSEYPETSNSKDEEIEELKEVIANNQQYQMGYRSGRSSRDEEVKKLKDAAIAYQNLSICYRIGKQPTEKLFKALDKAGKVLKEVDSK